ncbi:hypothetical protein SPRG_11297 [Saprolegnia parasitica CBS 223.65]|uniref:Uncharacterized protein n=1 Tax=Saprolegnia parasitica (strain CBS 223.65) TaxID=695850 RepID=A0A067CBF6_SAPPC|nr:hypothetical protein SPRG_11297 [Saprolegnia parasitica CBS 223.65]KDO23866.1 hypothetical protein SPRG_11297 [Saprolegnia parasitica CBS 223.65]|eukprot:XP_012205498.1 hypothetical protein SPRG_11297 [Saprolegnia parasitica CBS 223.65]
MQREPRKRRAKEPLAEPKARKTATTKKNATSKKTAANAASGVGEDVLALIIIELKKWRLFDPSSLCALAFTSKRIRAGLPFHDIVREATVPRLIERRRCALRQAYLNKHYFGVADDGGVWWKNAEYDREAAALEATPCTDADVLAYCQLSTPDWLHAFQNMHSRYQLTYLGDRHQLLVSYMCTFEMLISHLRRHLFFDRTPKLSINGTMPRKDAIVAQVLKQQRDGTISIVCPDFGHPHMFDLHLTKAPMTLMPGEDAVIERHLPIAHPPAHVNTETSSVEAWFPYLSKFISNGGQVSIGRQAHHHMMVLSGERIVHRHFKHMGSLQRYLESADQHCRRYFESAEDEYDPYADEDEDDEDADDEETATTDGVPSYNDGVSPSIPDTESECMVDGSRSFNADVVFPHLSKYISAKGWQSIELNVFGSRYATVHKGVQSNSIMAIAITHPPSTSLDHMLTELNACVAPGPLKARTDAIKKRKQQQELIPAHLKYRRFLFYMKHAQILQQGQVFRSRPGTTCMSTRWSATTSLRRRVPTRSSCSLSSVPPSRSVRKLAGRLARARRAERVPQDARLGALCGHEPGLPRALLAQRPRVLGRA